MTAQRQQRGIALVAVLVFLLVIAAVAALKGGEELGEINLAATDAELRQVEYVAQAGMQRAVWMAERSACSGDFTVPLTPLDADNYSATASGAGATTAYSMFADQDAWIRSDNPSNNQGTNNDLHIRFEGGDVEQALVQFDLSSLPVAARVNSASAWFFIESGKEHPAGAITVHRITADWTDTTVTWDSFNAAFEAQPLAMIPAQAQGGVWVQVNVTAQVQAWLNGQPNQGLLLQSLAEGVHAEYVSRDGAASQQPRLDVVIGTAPAAKINIQATGTLATGMSQNLYQPNASAYQSASAMAVQPGPAESNDAEIWDQAPNNNYGDAAETWVSSAASDTTRTLLRFDMDAIPAGAKILGASLFLTRQSGAGTNEPVSAHRITNSWSESIVSWNNREWFTPWNTAGGDFDPAAVATTPVGPTNQRYDWDITPLVQGWLDGSYPNHGVVLVAGVAGMTGHRFYTSDQGVLARRPGLSVTYACECGTACVVPQGTANILMVVGNPWSLTTGDIALRDLLESWGYTVDLIQDDNSQGNFNAKIASNDVVLVAESVSANNIGTKLTGSTKGVVSTEGQLNDELGIATGRNSPVGASMDVVDTSHFITQVFPAGAVEYMTAATEMQSVAGTVAPGAQALTQIGGAGALVVLDPGADLAGGGVAAGRRALLGIGEASFELFLSNNGQLLLQRTIEWARGGGTPPVGDLLMVVGNGFNLTAQEDAKKALIETWGYTVSVIDEDDNQAAFDTELAANDVVFVSEDVNDGDLANKLVNATIGVVTEEVNQANNLGFVSAIDWTSGTSINIVDNSHYVTQPFATGNLAVLSPSESLGIFDATPASGSQTLGRKDGAPALAALETGATIIGGGTAAGRRVVLPWGGSNMDLASLNSNGLTIFERALAWGAGATVPLTPIAHWPLDEGSGPTAVDIIGSNDATLNGGTTWTTGTLGGALDFDGSGDYAVTDSNFTPPPVGTVTFWMQVSGSPAAHGRILGLDDTWEIRHVTTGTSDGIPYGLVFDLGLSGENTEFVTTTTVDVPGRWYHIAAAYDTTTDAYAVYIDGIPHKSGTYPSSLTMPAANLLSIGTRTGSSNYFDGTLDDVRIYDRFLSAAEIADLASAGGSSGPVSHWKLDDGAGTTAIDSEGNNDGTLVNGPTWVAGQIGDALHFDGSNDYVDAGTFDVSGSGLTMMGWFNADTIPTSDPRIISKANGTDEADAWWQLSASDSGSNRYLRMRIKAGGTTTTLVDSSTNMLPGQWYLAVATYNAADGAMRLYLDGVEIASATHAVGGPVDAGPAVPVWIGANGTTARYFDGVLDDVRVYDKALSATEIANLYTAGGGGGGPPTIFEVRVAAVSDDAEERVSTGNVNLTSSDLELISDNSNTQLVGMRFTNITVPNGATISNAYVQFQVDETNSGATNVNVQAQDTDDAPTFTTSNSNISSRTRTSASVAWAPVPWTTVGDAGPDQRTPDIAAVIQEVVNRPGWVSGNDIVIIITGSGERTAESTSGESAAAPLLHIEY